MTCSIATRVPRLSVMTPFVTDWKLFALYWVVEVTSVLAMGDTVT